MKLEWKQFDIDMMGFLDFLIENVPEADGIIHSVEDFEIVMKSPISAEKESLIVSYYESLTEEGEIAKMERPAKLRAAHEACKIAVLSKNLSQLSEIEKKICFRFALTKDEEDLLIRQYA